MTHIRSIVFRNLVLQPRIANIYHTGFFLQRKSKKLFMGVIFLENINFWNTNRIYDCSEAESIHSLWVNNCFHIQRDIKCTTCTFPYGHIARHVCKMDALKLKCLHFDKISVLGCTARDENFVKMIIFQFHCWCCVCWSSEHPQRQSHYSDVIMSAIASQITGVLIVRSTICSRTDERKRQSSASLPLWGESTGDLWINLR